MLVYECTQVSDLKVYAQATSIMINDRMRTFRQVLTDDGLKAASCIRNL